MAAASDARSTKQQNFQKELGDQVGTFIFLTPFHWKQISCGLISQQTLVLAISFFFNKINSHLIWLGVLIIVIIIHKEKSHESFDLIAFFCSIVVHFLSGNDTGVFTRYNEFTLGICRAAIMYSKLAELSLEAFKLPKTIFFSLFLRTCAYLRRYFVKVCLMFSVCCLLLLHM